MSEHEHEHHEHGHDEGQHVHGDWQPDKVIARLQRDGFCGHQSHAGVCMRRDTHTHEET